MKTELTHELSGCTRSNQSEVRQLEPRKRKHALMQSR